MNQQKFEISIQLNIYVFMINEVYLRQLMVNVSGSVCTTLNLNVLRIIPSVIMALKEVRVFLTSNHFLYKESYHFSTVQNQKA